MFHGKLVTVAAAALLAMGCSPSSDKKAMSELFTSDAAPVVDADSETMADASADSLAPAPLVEVNASADQPGWDPLLANEGADDAQQPAHRPIMLPRLNYETVTRTETFEIGNDVTTREGILPIASTPPAQTAAVATVTSYSPEFSADPRFAPTYPDRPVPSRGMTQSEVLAVAGEPANKMAGIGSQVWDYGTYRVFFSQDEVAFTRVW